MKLSIIVPVYNEERFIEHSLERLAKVEFPIETEIIIVDDGSKDNSLVIAKEFKKKSKKDITIVTKKNEGKGSAIRVGIKISKGDIITFHDADLEYNPEDLKNLLESLLRSKKYKVVYGSRFRKKNNNWQIPSHYLGNMFLSTVMTLLYFNKIEDMETCYKMFYRSCLDGITLKSNKFEIEPEISAKFLKKGLKIKEIPIEYKARLFDEGKKIHFQDGIKALATIFEVRFS
mgnify:CR=1 FL=1